MDRETIRDTVASIRESQCMWTGCNKENEMFLPIRTMREKPDGELFDIDTVMGEHGEPLEGIGLSLPFCSFHTPFILEEIVGVVVDEDMKIVRFEGIEDVEYTLRVMRAFFAASGRGIF